MSMKRIKWLYTYYSAFICRQFNKIGIHLTPKFDIPNRPVFDRNFTNEVITEYIEHGNPTMIARFGGSETLAAIEEIGISLGCRRHFSKATFRGITRNAGVFPQDEKIIRRFSQLLIESGKQIDLLGMWRYPMQDYLINETCPDSVNISRLRFLEPFSYEKPWTSALRGKKVLVIHPFKKTIEQQYQKRELLFQNQEILPEFELRVVQAVQTIAYQKDPRFADWFEALDYMYMEAMKQDFDVAIIGCGAYGLPLAAKLKSAGKIAIHLGGVTQILFGIKGSRWDNDNVISKLYNSNWVRPLEEEMPQNAKIVENGCYW